MSTQVLQAYGKYSFFSDSRSEKSCFLEYVGTCNDTNFYTEYLEIFREQNRKEPNYN